MKYIKYIGLAGFSLMMLGIAATAQAQSECCPVPPYCTPTDACPIEMSAGQTEAESNQVIQVVSTAYEKASSAMKTVKKTITKARKAVTSIQDSVASAVRSVVTYPFKKAGQMMGLVKDEEEDKDGVAQDNSHGGDLSVEERMEKNLTTYTSESKSDYANEYFTVERRKYIRQQSTITLMARMLMLKARLKDIKKVVDDIDKEVKSGEQAASQADGDGNVTPSSNEAKVAGTSQELRIAWFQLLNYQKMIEAVKLEFAANQSISSMKLVKHIPTISSSGDGKSGSVEVKTKKDEKK